MRAATRQTVRGDFTQSRLTLNGAPFLLRSDNAGYYITEPVLTGKPVEHKIEYTLGDRRFQHYLTRQPNGSILILPPTWDIAAKKWSFDLDIGNPEESSGNPYQQWNKSCFSCHVSGEKKNFDPSVLSYRTTWRGLGIDCETCHGGGAAHVAKSGRTVSAGPIVNPAKLDAGRGTAVCAQCHSFRDLSVDGFEPGANYNDFFLPVMEYRLPGADDAAFWPDGRPRWLSNEAVALWQSQCYLRGNATCSSCHTHSHSLRGVGGAQLRAEANAACGKCHAAIAQNIQQHSHHAPNSAGAFCVECHMPATVLSLGTTMRDHALTVPAPENTLRHSIPNACNLCHSDKGAEWAVARLEMWDKSHVRQKMIRRADAFAAARKGDAGAVPALLEIFGDSASGAWLRANAAGYLANYPYDPAAYDAVFRALHDSEALVRATAATALKPSPGQRPAVASQLVTLLGDPSATVKLNVGIALVAMGVKDSQLTREEALRFAQAREIYSARAKLNNDDAQQQYAAGRFFLLAGEPKNASPAFSTSMKLDPAISAQYLMGVSLAQAGDYSASMEALKSVPASDAQYAAAQRLIPEIEAKSHAAAEAPPETVADVKFKTGEALYRDQYYGAALKDFEDALRLDPKASWAPRAQVYHAISLARLGRVSEAEPAMRTLISDAAGRENLDLQLAFVDLLYTTGRGEEALTHIDRLIRENPGAAMVYVWRARLLVQLRRNDEAARAAEEAIRIQPELPEAHNLLVRIYQMQGRAKEAAEEAAWLRDYQQRQKSR